jgi:hypothetical protein
VPLARLDVVDRYWRRQLTALPFRARLSSRNRPGRLGQRFSEDHLRALLVEVTRPQFSALATRAMRFAQLDEVDRDWRR